MLKVAIVDRCEVYRQGLEAVLARAGMAVVFAGATLGAQQPHRPDLIVLGEHEGPLPKSQPAVPVVQLTDNARHTPSNEVAVGQILGTVDRDASADSLVAAVHAMAGDNRKEAAVTPELSPREAQVLRRIAGGQTQHQVAHELDISHHTVDTYMRRIRSKLGPGNKAELARAAVLHGYTGTIQQA